MPGNVARASPLSFYSVPSAVGASPSMAVTTQLPRFCASCLQTAPPLLAGREKQTIPCVSLAKMWSPGLRGAEIGRLWPLEVAGSLSLQSSAGARDMIRLCQHTREHCMPCAGASKNQRGPSSKATRSTRFRTCWVVSGSSCEILTFAVFQ